MGKSKKITEATVLNLIRKTYKAYLDSEPTGFPAILYTDNRFQRTFAKAIARHGTNGSLVHQELIKARFMITSKTVHAYLRKLFGSYGRKGRPSKYLPSERKK
jgi:hypothetical protein